ncbi:winged helix DNA-binding domain-containing protein, partial [Neolentinus lepideus HHB14362 ss-1]
DPGPTLRQMLSIPADVPINLRAIPDPPQGEKPKQPYPVLVQLAIYGSPRRRLTLQEIYAALEDRFEWFRERSKEMQWKNSIRHNLSLNKVFRQVPRPITEPGKGKYWVVDLSEGTGNKRERKRNRK